MQTIARLEKQVDQEKQLNTNLTAEIESCRRESRLLKESTLASSQDQSKQVNSNQFLRNFTEFSFDGKFWKIILQAAELKRLNDEHAERFGKQVDELQRLNAKLNEASLVNKQLNDELNEKTEQICHLHSENSR